MSAGLRALVTRPREDAQAVAELLRRRGIEPVIEPLLAIVPVARPALDLTGVQAILFTSANGVRAFAAACGNRALPVFAVGDATAEAARGAGFARVESAGGDAEDLARLVEAKLQPARGALLHVAGSAQAGDIARRLSTAGFAVRRAVLYEARPADALSPQVAAELARNAIAWALFFSPRTARTFVSLAQKAGLTPACRGMTAFCLSEAVARALAGLPWKDVRRAAEPTLPALMKEIDAALARQAQD